MHNPEIQLSVHFPQFFLNLFNDSSIYVFSQNKIMLYLLHCNLPFLSYMYNQHLFELQACFVFYYLVF